MGGHEEPSDHSSQRNDLQVPGEGASEEEIKRYAHAAATRPVITPGQKKAFEEQQQIMQETGPYLTMGMQMVLTIGAFFGVGYWLDGKYDTSPLWTAVLSGIGAAGSLTYFIVTVLRLSKKTETKRP